MKYRKKPVVIEAFQYSATRDFSGWPDWAKVELKHNVDSLVTSRDGDSRRKITAHADWLEVRTLEGVMRAIVGDWIIRGVEGEIYPCKPNIFAATYEKVDEGRLVPHHGSGGMEIPTKQSGGVK